MISPDYAFARPLLGLVLIALLGLLAIRAARKDARAYQRFKRYTDTRRRQRMYRRWLVNSMLSFGASSIVVLALVWQYIPLLLERVEAYGWVRGFRAAYSASGWWGPGISIGVVVLVIGGTTVAIFSARHSDEVMAIGDIQALLPRNRQELRYGAALSINAGVVEEVLFRLAVPALLFGVIGNAAIAIILSIVLFGSLHLYQGLAGVVGSAIIGMLLMAVYLSTGSIVTAIVLHALIDLRSLVLIPVVLLRVHLVDGEAPTDTSASLRGPLAATDAPGIEPGRQGDPVAAGEPAPPLEP